MRELFYLVTDDDECFDETRCTIFNNADAEEAWNYANFNEERGLYMLEADIPSTFDFVPIIFHPHPYGRGELDRFYITLEAEYCDPENNVRYPVMFKIDKSNLTKLDK